MARFPLRVGRSRSIWEDGTVEEIVRKEFRSAAGEVDLRPSVYLVDPDEAVRAVAEHVSQRLSPSFPTSADELNAAGLAPVEWSRASGHFEFTNERHAELIVQGEQDLFALVAILRAEPNRRLRRSRDLIMGFVADRVRAGDPEWQRLLQSRPAWAVALQKWLKKAE